MTTLNDHLGPWLAARRQRMIERRLIAGCFAVTVACCLGVALHAEGNHNGSGMGGEGGQGGGDYGHTTDYCGSECGNGAVFIGSGRNGPAFSSSHVGSGYASQASRNGF